METALNVVVFTVPALLAALAIVAHARNEYLCWRSALAAKAAARPLALAGAFVTLYLLGLVLVLVPAALTAARMGWLVTH